MSETCVPPPVRSLTPGKGLRGKGNQNVVLSYGHFKKQSKNNPSPNTAGAEGGAEPSLSSWKQQITCPPAPPPEEDAFPLLEGE